jgi:hypothetical protein
VEFDWIDPKEANIDKANNKIEDMGIRWLVRGNWSNLMR